MTVKLRLSISIRAKITTRILMIIVMMTIKPLIISSIIIVLVSIMWPSCSPLSSLKLPGTIVSLVWGRRSLSIGREGRSRSLLVGGRRLAHVRK